MKAFTISFVFTLVFVIMYIGILLRVPFYSKEKMKNAMPQVKGIVLFFCPNRQFVVRH